MLQAGQEYLLTSGGNAAIDNVAKQLDAEALRQVARYLAESVGGKIDQSILDLYKPGVFPQQAEKEVANQYGASKKWHSRVRKQCMRLLVDYKSGL